jgi:hypothetical protein
MVDPGYHAREFSSLNHAHVQLRVGSDRHFIEIKILTGTTPPSPSMAIQPALFPLFLQFYKYAFQA